MILTKRRLRMMYRWAEEVFRPVNTPIVSDKPILEEPIVSETSASVSVATRMIHPRCRLILSFPVDQVEEDLEAPARWGPWRRTTSASKPLTVAFRSLYGLVVLNSRIVASSLSPPRRKKNQLGVFFNQQLLEYVQYSPSAATFNPPAFSIISWRNVSPVAAESKEPKSRAM